MVMGEQGPEGSPLQLSSLSEQSERGQGRGALSSSKATLEPALILLRGLWADHQPGCE